MKRIVWLASYPKSGNTWIRILLANYLTLNPSREATRLDRLEFARIASLRALFDDWSSVESSEMTTEDAFDIRADVYRAVARSSTERHVYLKVHDAWLGNASGHSIFPAEATIAAVYILRHPFDVTVSLAHHLDVSLDDAVSMVCSDAFTLFPGDQTLSPQFPQHVASWARHVASWNDEAGIPIILIKYEDLHRSTHGTLRRLLEALAVPVDDERLDRAVEVSAFTHLQKMEQASGFPERRSRKTMFFRGGRVGDGIAVLSAAHMERINCSAGSIMTRFGYGTEVIRDEGGTAWKQPTHRA